MTILDILYWIILFPNQSSSCINISQFYPPIYPHVVGQNLIEPTGVDQPLLVSGLITREFSTVIRSVVQTLARRPGGGVAAGETQLDTQDH